MTGVVSRCGVSDCRVWYGNRADTNGTHTHAHTHTSADCILESSMLRSVRWKVEVIFRASLLCLTNSSLTVLARRVAFRASSLIEGPNWKCTVVIIKLGKDEISELNHT